MESGEGDEVSSKVPVLDPLRTLGLAPHDLGRPWAELETLLENQLEHHRQLLEESLAATERRILSTVMSEARSQSQPLATAFTPPPVAAYQPPESPTGSLSTDGWNCRHPVTRLVHDHEQPVRATELQLPGVVCGGYRGESPAKDDKPFRSSVSDPQGSKPQLRRTMTDVTVLEDDDLQHQRTFTISSVFGEKSQWRRMIQRRVSQESARRRTWFRFDKDLITEHGRQRLANSSTSLYRAVHSLPFEIMSAATTLGNAVFVGFQVDVLLKESATGQTQPLTSSGVASGVAVAFCILFALELAMRLVADRIKFVTSSDRGWNIFDFVVVVSNIIDIGTQADSEGPSVSVSKLGVLRVLRLLRTVRILRVIRNATIFKELRTILSAMVASVRHLIWVLMVLFVWVYMSAVTLSTGVAEFCVPARDCANNYPALQLYFGSIPMSIWTLFMNMYGGMDLSVMWGYLSELDWTYQIVYFLFIVLSSIVVVNIVTGVFVEMTVAATASDRECMIQEQREHTAAYLDGMTAMFQEIDVNNSGSITFEEFEERLQDDRALAYFDALKLDIGEVRTLFTLLDSDESGSVDLEEFLLGCKRLSGESRAMDVAVMKLQLQRLSDFLVSFAEDVSDKLDTCIGTQSQCSSPNRPRKNRRKTTQASASHKAG